MKIKLIYALLGVLLISSLCNAQLMYDPQWSAVEKTFLAKNTLPTKFSTEKIAVIETADPYELGKLAALRFIEWVIANPRGVIGLTSGSTPEYFVKYLKFYKNNWNKPEIKSELESYGINSPKFPDTSQLRLVQLDAYYPLSPKHHKNVTNYIKRNYVKLLEIPEKNVLYMNSSGRGILAEKGHNVVFMNGEVDMELRDRKPSSQLESWQKQAILEAEELCKEYELTIRNLGGIGFYLGTISYGGHIGLNLPGENFDAPTHIMKLDYIAAANSAKDLGGIEHARGKVGITVGLGTLTFNKDAVLITMASGETKAVAVRDAVQGEYGTNFPGTVFQQYPNARFYVTSGAAQELEERSAAKLERKTYKKWTTIDYANVVIPIALKEKKTLLDLDYNILNKYPNGKLLLKHKSSSLPAILTSVRDYIISGIQRGVRLDVHGTKILHTAPHHDDIMLAYYPIIDKLLENHDNHFAYLTSGFNSVSDTYLLSIINRASDWWINKEKEFIFERSYASVLRKYSLHYSRNDVQQLSLIDTLIALRSLVQIYDLKTPEELKYTVRWLKDKYFPSKNPGDLDIAEIQMFKGMIRESEVDRLWILKKISLENISHMRSSFYSGEEFKASPDPNKDVKAFKELVLSFNPDLITVADDPQGIKPDTHYIVLQMITQALREDKNKINKNIKIWGYRNVWHRYQIQEANIFIPVSKKMQQENKQAFIDCFGTQKLASFPSPFYEGNFGGLIVDNQKLQLQELKTILGKDYFSNNSISAIRNAEGFIFLKEMQLDELLNNVADLRGNEVEWQS